MVALEVALLLLRELLRTLLVPFRVACYLPARRHWRRVAQEVLAGVAAGDGAPPEAALAAFLQRRRPRRGTVPHLFVSAGEQSGENHAANLLRALAADGLRCTAFGGQRLAAAGADVRFQLSEHAVMGIVGVLRQLPRILRAVATFLRLLRDDPPDLVVLVDFPGLHVVLAKCCRRRGIPVLHYIAPQYWAWGPWRMRRYRRAVDATLTILPFETAFFARFQVPAVYVGHPLLDAMAAEPPAPGEVAAVRARPTLVLLPGSRRKEILHNLPGQLQVARGLAAAAPGLRVVLPHHDPARTPLLRELLATHGGDFVEHHEGPLAPWLAGARLVLAKSGTGSLEACLFGAPTIVVYKLSGMLSALGYHNILSVPWIAAANLVAGRTVVPEFCFHGDAGWQRVLERALCLWRDGEERAAMLRDLAEVRNRLGSGGASARVALIVRRFLTEEPK